MTFAEQLFTKLAAARSQRGNVLTKEQWLQIAQEAFDSAVRLAVDAKNDSGFAAPRKRKVRRNSPPPPEPIPEAVYHEPDPVLWKATALRLYPDTVLADWITEGSKEWSGLPVLVRKAIVEEIARQPADF